MKSKRIFLTLFLTGVFMILIISCRHSDEKPEKDSTQLSSDDQIKPGSSDLQIEEMEDAVRVGDQVWMKENLLEIYYEDIMQSNPETGPEKIVSGSADYKVRVPVPGEG